MTHVMLPLRHDLQSSAHTNGKSTVKLAHCAVGGRQVNMKKGGRLLFLSQGHCCLIKGLIKSFS